jgi:hypothetical protein
MRIAILVEGKTEKAFKPYLLAYLQKRLPGKMPRLEIWPYDGRIPTGDKLKRVVGNLLNDKKRPADAVIALTDVYTGSIPPEFPTAEAARQKMRGWAGAEARLYPHVALHDCEAWLLPKANKPLRGCRSGSRIAIIFAFPAGNGRAGDNRRSRIHTLSKLADAKNS